VTIGGGLHAFKMDVSGRYIVVGVANGSSSVWLWDTQAMTIVAASNLPDGPGVGWAGYERDGKNDSYDWTISQFGLDASTPLIAPNLSPTDSLATSSVSWENAVGTGSAPIVVETMRSPSDTSAWRAWDEEVLAVRTDGVSSDVWRFAHTFNTYSGPTASDAYYYLYKPRVSQNGWFVLYDSNWNSSLGTDGSGQPRTDAFIVALSNPCGP
jgi:hypothetical protein